MKNFGLIGAAGYVAPRHMKAIKESGHRLAVALDKHDSVGILDSYFPEADFFTEFERFDRHVDKLRRRNDPRALDYLSICSPNYLHDAHIRFALRSGQHAVCEKPLVINPWNLDALEDIQRNAGDRAIYTILQLRLHPSVQELAKRVASEQDKIYDIDLGYITSRGRWYDYSWKGDDHKSGGIATNIGIHFFDMLIWIFGEVQRNVVHVLEPHRAAGFLLLKRARVRWFLSIDAGDLPQEARKEGQRTWRSLQLGDRQFEFSSGFTDLHTQSYRQIVSGQGFGITHARPSIECVYAIRTAQPAGLVGDYHPAADPKNR
ncbi:MAG: Gfo/Idh/MocA family oxidoreductase [Acidobacteriota bacterium]|nr:Gfo/Idh/MocA family oxidoreductase [Acidobacteriota bacterium]